MEGLDELLLWLEEFDNKPFKPTYRNMIEKIWQIKTEKQCAINGVRRSLFNEVYDKLIELDKDLVKFESWVNSNC